MASCKHNNYSNFVILLKLVHKPSYISHTRYNLALRILYTFDYKIVLLTCSVDFLLQSPQQDPSSPSQGAHTLLKTEWGQVSKKRNLLLHSLKFLFNFQISYFKVSISLYYKNQLLFAMDLFHDLPEITDLRLLIFAIKM